METRAAASLTSSSAAGSGGVAAYLTELHIMPSVVGGPLYIDHMRCLYTSNTLMVWLRALRITRIGFVVMPIVFGALASWEILKGNSRYEYITATMALIAGLVPAVYAALKLDEHLPTATRLAGEYKNLEIVFRDLGAIGPHKPFTCSKLNTRRRGVG
jgi:hypothetical protein